MSEFLSTGKIFLPNKGPPGRPGLLYGQVPEKPALSDPRNACADALSAYLWNLRFTRWGGTAENTPFNLKVVRPEWPEPEKPIEYPSASVIDAEDGEMAAHSFTPTPLEDTYGVFGDGSMLWKLAELVIPFQVDFWTDDAPTRDAIGARLPGAFAPGEDQYGIVLCGSPLYWDRPVRATFLSSQRMDNSESIYPRERRLMCRFLCEIDVVELRCSALLQPQYTLEAGETVEPACVPELESISCEET